MSAENRKFLFLERPWHMRETDANSQLSIVAEVLCNGYKRHPDKVLDTLGSLDPKSRGKTKNCSGQSFLRWINCLRVIPWSVDRETLPKRYSILRFRCFQCVCPVLQQTQYRNKIYSIVAFEAFEVVCNDGKILVEIKQSKIFILWKNTAFVKVAAEMC